MSPVSQAGLEYDGRREAAAAETPRSMRVTWWASLLDENGRPVDPIVFAPWELLIREAEFAVTRGGTWVAHVPSLLLVVWPENRTVRKEAMTRYTASVAALHAAKDELARRRARAALRVVETTLGVLRALEVLAAIVPNAIAVEVDSPADRGKVRAWRHACLSATALPATPGR